MLATLLEREDPPNVAGATELRGFVESVGVTSFTILGVTIDDGAMFCGITCVDDLSVGDQVSVDGTETSSTTILADEVQLEN